MSYYDWDGKGRMTASPFLACETPDIIVVRPRSEKRNLGGSLT